MTRPLCGTAAWPARLRAALVLLAAGIACGIYGSANAFRHMSLGPPWTAVAMVPAALVLEGLALAIAFWPGARRPAARRPGSRTTGSGQ